MKNFPVFVSDISNGYTTSHKTVSLTIPLIVIFANVENKML